MGILKNKEIKKANAGYNDEVEIEKELDKLAATGIIKDAVPVYAKLRKERINMHNNGLALVNNYRKNPLPAHLGLNGVTLFSIILLVWFFLLEILLSGGVYHAYDPSQVYSRGEAILHLVKSILTLFCGIAATISFVHIILNIVRARKLFLLDLFIDACAFSGLTVLCGLDKSIFPTYIFLQIRILVESIAAIL